MRAEHMQAMINKVAGECVAVRLRMLNRVITNIYDDALRPLDIIQEELEPPVVRTEGLVPDPHAVPPDELASQKDVLAQLQEDMRNWPRPEREVFELYFVEGLEAEEIAMVTGRPLKTVRESIASIQQRLREEMLEKALV